MTNVLAINAGSSSLKFQLIEMPAEKVLAMGAIDRIGLPNSSFTMDIGGKEKKKITEIPDHAEAVKQLLEKLTSSGSISSLEEINRSEEHTSELQSRGHLVCRLLLEKKNIG